MVERQLRHRGIGDERVLAAMGRVPRELFVPEAERREAYVDGALPIGGGQTISQPLMVATMLELASVEPGDRVLDVGTGSGYAAAVLAELGAVVTSIERIPALARSAAAALREAGYSGVDVRVGDGSLGTPDEAPFDAILVAAAAPEPPRALESQLRLGGRLVVPVGSRYEQRLVCVVRTERGPETTASVPCRFVPLLGAEGFAR